MTLFSCADRPAALRAKWREHQKINKDSLEADLVIGLSASFTVDPLEPYLGAYALEAGYSAPLIKNADYNQILQTCMDYKQAFDGITPEIIVILWRLEDLGDVSDAGRIGEARDLLLDAIRHLRSKFSGMIILCGPSRPRPPTGNMTRFARPSALDHLWHDSMAQIHALLNEIEQIYSCDLEECIATQGLSRALDERNSFLYRQPFSQTVYQHMAAAIARLARARSLEAKKCIVLDCDNTLWGGIIGEDGVGGIALGQDFPGSAFREFQRQIKMLRDSGIFVALNSKNNEEDVWEVFDTHQEMVLERKDISIACINWHPKSDNLKLIAKQLNIGLDALVFVDDSSFELEEVRTHAPEVTLVHVPQDISLLPAIMRDHAHLFDRLDITQDDLKRVDMMHGEQKRRETSSSMTTDDFLASLALKASIYTPAEADYARVVQLINKTNQFNLTTRRYAMDELLAFMENSEYNVYCLSVSDKFGDYGLVGVAITRAEGEKAIFDSLLMSCRVLGRGVETALIAHIAADQQRRGKTRLCGQYIPTRKNRMVADLFSRHDFQKVSSDANQSTTEKATVWEIEVKDCKRPPDFLTAHNGRPG